MELWKRKSIEENVCRDWGSCIRETRVGPLLWCDCKFCTVERFHNSSITSQRVWTGLGREDYGTLSRFPFIYSIGALSLCEFICTLQMHLYNAMLHSYLYSVSPIFLVPHMSEEMTGAICRPLSSELFQLPSCITLMCKCIWAVLISIAHYSRGEMSQHSNNQLPNPDIRGHCCWIMQTYVLKVKLLRRVVLTYFIGVHDICFSYSLSLGEKKEAWTETPKIVQLLSSTFLRLSIYLLGLICPILCKLKDQFLKMLIGW